MAGGNQELDQQGSHADSQAVDFDFLARQTFDDIALECEVLILFNTQSRRIVPMLRQMGAREQSDAAHLLSGSARGIGAWQAAATAGAYEAAAPADRATLYPALVAAFAAAEVAIEARLARAKPGV